MNPEQRHLAPLDKTKQLETGGKAEKTFNLIKARSELPQKIDELKHRLFEIQKEQKQLKNPLEGNAHMNEAILAYQRAFPNQRKALQ